MPMGFCAILGGTITMVGSSPLILLNDLIESSNSTLPGGVAPMATFSLFAVTPIGLALVVTGILYFVVLGRVVLPVVKDKPQESGSTLQYFREVYGIQGEVYEARVVADSPLGWNHFRYRRGWKGRLDSCCSKPDDIRVAPRGDTELHSGLIWPSWVGGMLLSVFVWKRTGNETKNPKFY
ncbi:MAG: hypothetical protein Ct9H300mP14_06990 [Gammaproteobacteria bacterium]|nr:MAG: hypothetical protein Ct9H300mP14_06990 [Gammaproteobacteria bacterium]